MATGTESNKDPAAPNGADPTAQQYVPPPDLTDISDLYVASGQADPLTTITIHKVPVGKPKEFIRTVSDPSYRQRVEIYCHKTEDTIQEEYFIIGPNLRDQIQEAQPCLLVTVVNRVGYPRIWPIKLPKDGDKDNIAWQTSRAIARTGLSEWVRPVWGGSGHGFIERKAEPGYAPDPDYTNLPPFDELVKAAFGTHNVIRNKSHPIYRDLFGLKPPVADDGADPLL
jgi:hypothetical protein